MYGIQICVNGKPRGGENDILYKNVECRNYMINKFSDDKIFWESEELIVLLDGVILNKKELIVSEKQESWIDTVVSLYKKDSETFFRVLRGSFAGALYEKAAGKLTVFTDQLGTKFIYYCHVGDKLLISQMAGDGMYNLLKEQSIDYHLDSESAKLLMTYGFMIEDYTLCKEVRKLEPGCYLTFQNGIIDIQRYYMLDNTPDTSLTEDSAIETIDRLFRQAVTREYEKDLEYGYHHICTLSGGLDSRMTTWVAHDLGYTSQTNVTFSQTGYYDQTIPQQIAEDLKHEWLFKALDNGLWLYDVDDVTRTTGGNVLYYGTAHGNSLYKYMSFDKLGLFHSGQLGGVVPSTRVSNGYGEYKLGQGAYSTRFIEELSISPKLKVNEEIGYFYYRYLNGTCNGQQNIYNYTETLSPFLDLDFIEFALTIPVSIRLNHHIYKKWILQKYPAAAKYIWEKTGCRIDARMIHLGKMEKPLVKVPSLILARLGIFKREANSKKHMNPIGYYLAHNESLFTYLKSYFKYVDKISDDSVRKMAETIEKNGSPMEKIQLVTLLATIKLYYAE
jgi:asparagine synthase (glutamine-hydrolysing)